MGQFLQECVRWIFVIYIKKRFVIYNEEKSDDFLSTPRVTRTVLIKKKIKNGRDK